MLRLCSDSSRSYPGRLVRLCRFRCLEAAPCMATCRVTGQKSAEAIVGDRTPSRSDWTAGNKPGIVTDSREDLPRRRAEHREGEVPNELS
jgi:hypothetical protein